MHTGMLQPLERCAPWKGSRAIMKMTTMKGDYGLRAMLDMAAYYGQGPIESADIAGRQYIPEQYLDQILMVLRKEGLVKSVRGPKGGHMLAKPPAQITMAQVIHALEGYIPPMECLPNPDFCKLSPGCALREVWLKVDEMTQQYLNAMTIEELAQRHQVDSLETMYHI
jgi:Rrf2 family protein